jgi:hypothetical protein
MKLLSARSDEGTDFHPLSGTHYAFFGVLRTDARGTRMLDWVKKARGGPDHPMRSASSASALLAKLRGTDGISALDELSGWLESLRDAEGFDEAVRSQVLGLIQQAGEAHIAALLANHLANQAETALAREAKWKALFDYADTLSEVLCESAERVAAAAVGDAHRVSAAAAGAARGLSACRTLAKVCLMRYRDVPSDLWRRAYSVHATAETGGFATTAAHTHPDQQTATTATEELLRLLMLHVSMPDMMAPEQIEVAERVVLQMGSDFTLRPAGFADAAFCFDPESKLPPRRAASQQAAPPASTRYFGPGAALDALARLHKQVMAEDLAKVKAFGKDIGPHAQIRTIEHLQRFWAENLSFSPPAHAPATGQLLVVHRYEQLCLHLPDAASASNQAGALAMTDSEKVKPEPPETWALRDAGSGELGAEVPQSSVGWARSGELLGIHVQSRNEWWLGVVRRLHAERLTHADIAILSRAPLVLKLRVMGKDIPLPEGWETSTDAFSYRYLDAILLPDASEKLGVLNMLLPAEGWKVRRVYEAMAWEPTRYLRIVRLLRHGQGFARVEFEWLPRP